MALSDTIGVIYRGRLVGVLPRAQANIELLGLMMAGEALAAARREAPLGGQPSPDELALGG